MVWEVYMKHSSSVWYITSSFFCQHWDHQQIKISTDTSLVKYCKVYSIHINILLFFYRYFTDTEKGIVGFHTGETTSYHKANGLRNCHCLFLTLRTFARTSSTIQVFFILLPQLDYNSPLAEMQCKNKNKIKLGITDLVFHGALPFCN